MNEKNEKNTSIIPNSSTGLISVGNSIEITNKLIQEHEKRSVSTKLKTTIIGNQEWTTENLDVDCYSDGTPIPEITNPQEWSRIKTGAWCYLNNDPENGKKFGKIYNSFVFNSPQNIIPSGFRIPTQDDLLVLKQNTQSNKWLGVLKGKRHEWEWDAFHLKSNNGWKINGDNHYKFSMESGGLRDFSGKFFHDSTGFWTNSLTSNYDPLILFFKDHELRYFAFSNARITKFEINGGCYIRFLKDNV